MVFLQNSELLKKFLSLEFVVESHLLNCKDRYDNTVLHYVAMVDNHAITTLVIDSLIQLRQSSPSGDRQVREFVQALNCAGKSPLDFANKYLSTDFKSREFFVGQHMTVSTNNT